VDYYGYNPPWIGGHQGVMSKQSGQRLIKNDVLQLLLTGRGERVMRPDFGTTIAATLFEPIDSTTVENLKLDIIGQLQTYEPRIEATVDVDVKEDDHIIYIVIVGHLSERPNEDFLLEIEVPLRSE